ncbi:hypothetical protein CONPUDRAFT_158943 [Coniophora puteana RWD-64-598 SS2]|uniref:Uncharacterized protein n=1 Tax=Coniophora puteana (strain RWD-64-598) TaxID=741705 RepID=A0A5M3MA08_CONPW|nr:uncharacterized protein CONPUDRAFT_158943 [Coniophora puteana RWD-64-598 SS2]EIW75481.1 hypothetical protein CONPUDRAFT_158943 [Coniophora puteana RWD-64-598 SS2]
MRPTDESSKLASLSRYSISRSYIHSSCLTTHQFISMAQYSGKILATPMRLALDAATGTSRSSQRTLLGKRSRSRSDAAILLNSQNLHQSSLQYAVPITPAPATRSRRSWALAVSGVSSQLDVPTGGDDPDEEENVPQAEKERENFGVWLDDNSTASVPPAPRPVRIRKVLADLDLNVARGDPFVGSHQPRATHGDLSSLLMPSSPMSSPSTRARARPSNTRSEQARATLDALREEDAVPKDVNPNRVPTTSQDTKRRRVTQPNSQLVSGPQCSARRTSRSTCPTSSASVPPPRSTPEEPLTATPSSATPFAAKLPSSSVSDRLLRSHTKLQRAHSDNLGARHFNVDTAFITLTRPRYKFRRTRSAPTESNVAGARQRHRRRDQEHDASGSGPPSQPVSHRVPNSVSRSLVNSGDSLQVFGHKQLCEDVARGDADVSVSR